MSLSVETEPVPLVADADGVMRISHTRVTLDTLVTAFLGGATPEEIVQQYPSLGLGDVYAVIAYYLRRRSDVESYLAAREQEAQAVRVDNEARSQPAGIRARLLARQSPAP
jgi:uncharacterized protein (DUF433 family)